MNFTIKSLLLSTVLVVAPLSFAAGEAPKPDTPILDAAFKTAQQRKVPVFIDFQAPWCYSCYFMAQHVLIGSRWEAVERQTVFIEVDADSPEGAYWKTLWGVKALPSYVILNPDGAELGRVLGERTPDEFFSQVETMLQRNSTLDDLRAAAAKGDLNAARDALKLSHARYDAGGLDWFATLPESLRKRYAADSAVALTLARLELLRASQASNANACTALAPQVLAGDLGCERPYEIDRWAACAAKLPDAERRPVLESQLDPMRKLVDDRVFGKGPLCADQRSAVLGLYDVYDGLGRTGEGRSVLRRAADAVAAKASDQLGADRNRADNWRVYLEVLEDQAGLDALYPKLIAAYPDDYVYSFRYGRNLLARGDAAKALPYLEQAATKAYGQNRLKVAEQRVLALKALQRGAEARKVVAEALKANGPWFPEDAAKLKSLL